MQAMASNTGTAETGEQHGNVKRSPSQTAKVRTCLALWLGIWRLLSLWSTCSQVRTKMGRSAETAIGIPGLSWVSIGCEDLLCWLCCSCGTAQGGDWSELPGCRIVPWEPINGSLFKVRGASCAHLPGTAPVLKGPALQAAWAELAATLLFIYLTTVRALSCMLCGAPAA